MPAPITVGVVGAGRIGKMHAENIKNFFPGVRVKTVVEANLTPEISAWGAGLGFETVTGDPAALFGDPEIDAVLICSSTDTHADLVIDAARAGKHIFCEKPVDLTLEKVVAALAAVRKAGVKLQVGFNRRFDHNFARARQHVAAGAIGTPHLVKIASRDPAPPPVSYIAVSGGIFLDMMIHDFDMARFQAGSEVVEVYASGAVLVDEAIGKAGDVDTAVVTLRFANGAIGVIDNSRKAVYGYDQRLEVFGSKGSVVAENDLPNTVKVLTETEVTTDKPLYFFLERYRDSYLNELGAFFAAVAGEAEVPVTGEDGLRDLVVAMAARTSLREGRPVAISEIEVPVAA